MAEVQAVSTSAEDGSNTEKTRSDSLSSMPLSVCSSAYFGSESSIGSLAVHRSNRPPRPRSRPNSRPSSVVKSSEAVETETWLQKENDEFVFSKPPLPPKPKGIVIKSATKPADDAQKHKHIVEHANARGIPIGPIYDVAEFCSSDSDAYAIPVPVQKKDRQTQMPHGIDEGERTYSFARKANEGAGYMLAKAADPALIISPEYENVQPPHTLDGMAIEENSAINRNSVQSVSDMYTQPCGNEPKTPDVYSTIDEVRSTSAVYALIDSDPSSSENDERNLISLPMDESHRSRLSSLDTILVEDNAFDLLISYTMETFCVGDLLLWLDIQQFSDMDVGSEIRRQYANMIVRKYLSTESELTASLPDTVRNRILELLQHGPWTNTMFSQANDYLKETLTRTVLPGFFKSPAGMAYSIQALSKEHSSRRQSMEDAIIPAGAKIIGFTKKYDPTEKYYTYIVEIRAERMTFKVWRRYSEFHAYFTQLKKQYRSLASNLGHFPRKLLMRSQIRKVATHRMGELNEFLTRMLGIDMVRTSDTTLQFFRQRLIDVQREKEELEKGSDIPPKGIYLSN